MRVRPEQGRTFGAEGAVTEGGALGRQLGDEAVNGAGERRPLQDFLPGPVSALAGVARPEVFFDMLRARGLALHEAVALPDHADAASLLAALADLPGPVLCTDKDRVKLPADAGQQNVWSVPLQLTVESGFFDALDRLLPSPPG